MRHVGTLLEIRVQFHSNPPPLPLQTFYSQVSSPLLRRITVQFPDDVVSDVTQNRFDKYFSGSELVVAGKVLPSESNTLTSFTTASAVSIMNTTIRHYTCENFPLSTYIFKPIIQWFSVWGVSIPSWFWSHKSLELPSIYLILDRLVKHYAM